MKNISMEKHAIKRFKLSIIFCCLTFFVLQTTAIETSSQFETTVNVVYFESSKWTLEELQIRYNRVTDFFIKCNLKIKVNYIKSRQKFSETPVFHGNNEQESTDSFAESLSDLPYNIYVIHVDSLKDEKGLSVGAISAPLIRFSNNSKLVHKNWIAFPSLEDNMLYTNDNLGLIEAHELAHDLFNSDHVSGNQNILSTLTVPKWSVTSEQCKRLSFNSKVYKK